MIGVEEIDFHFQGCLPSRRQSGEIISSADGILNSIGRAMTISIKWTGHEAKEVLRFNYSSKGSNRVIFRGQSSITGDIILKLERFDADADGIADACSLEK